MSSEHSFLTGMEHEKSVDLLFTDPPCDSWFEKERPNSQHKLLTEEYMKQLVQVAYEVMKTGSYAHILCSTGQFRN